MRSLEDLLDSLVTATETYKLEWNSDHVDTYSASLSEEIHLIIWKWTDPDSDDSGITVRLLKNSKVIDEIVSDEYSRQYENLFSLFSAARRSAHGVDSIIGDIENILSSLKPKR